MTGEYTQQQSVCQIFKKENGYVFICLLAFSFSLSHSLTIKDGKKFDRKAKI